MSHQLLPDRSTATVPQRLTFSEMLSLGVGPLLAMGLFVGLGIAAGAAGSALMGSLVLAGGVALINGASIAQLAVAQGSLPLLEGDEPLPPFPTLRPWLQFTAHWLLFLFRFTTAAVAALGVAGYGLSAARIDIVWLVPLALLVTLLGTIGVWRCSAPRTLDDATVNATSRTLLKLRLGSVIVAGLALLLLLVAGWMWMLRLGLPIGLPSSAHPVSWVAGLQSTALLLSFYGGYETILRLPVHPVSSRLLPIAIGLIAGLSLILSLGIALVGLGVVGAPVLASAVTADVAPLLAIVRGLGVHPGWTYGLAIAAILVMLTLLLEHIHTLAIALPSLVHPEWVDPLSRNPKRNPDSRTAHSASAQWAVALVGVAIACLVLVGEVETIWAFSAFTMLFYNAITHFAVLHLPNATRLYPRWLAVLGLGVCLGLVGWLQWDVWLVGLGLISLGLIWRGISQWADDPPVS
ncbi:MAG: hypothetical protein IGS38_03195 [Synechococcales cyanobacterium M58_A2018_015]|nr:hypothetical protein [Synechococcales cyanobacterium M58_A2018_015]